jgi:hypothetical protein
MGAFYLMELLPPRIFGGSNSPYACNVFTNTTPVPLKAEDWF